MEKENIMQYDIKRKETRQGEERNITIQITTSNNNETTTTLITKSNESLNQNKAKHTTCSYNESQDDTNDKENRTPNKRTKISIQIMTKTNERK